MDYEKAESSRDKLNSLFGKQDANSIKIDKKYLPELIDPSLLTFERSNGLPILKSEFEEYLRDFRILIYNSIDFVKFSKKPPNFNDIFKKILKGGKILFSANTEHDIVKGVIEKLKEWKSEHWIFHDPTKQYFDLETMTQQFEGVEYMVVKVANECSLDLLYFAKLHKIPALHDLDAVLMCKNKVSLDQSLRKVFRAHALNLKTFALPQSWTQSLLDPLVFKEWAADKLPIVIKSHYQHDKFMRFNFLVREINEIDKFREKYAQFLYYNVYIQKFVECDGIDRKIYVVGDQVFGVQRENPIYIFIKERPDDINVDAIWRQEFKITPEIRTLARILSESLKLKIFGFDLLKSTRDDLFYLIDLNDFPGLRGIRGIEDAIVNLLKKILER